MSHNVKVNSKKVKGIQIRTREVSLFYDTPHPSTFVAITPLPWARLCKFPSSVHIVASFCLFAAWQQHRGTNFAS